MKTIASVFVMVIALSVPLSAQYAFNSKPADLAGSMNSAKVKHPMLHTGFFIRTGVFLPTSKYYHPIEEISFDTNYSNIGFNFQVGTAFYFGPPIANMLRFGMDASWLDFSLATLNEDDFDTGAFTLDMKFVGLGPLISFSPMRKIAIDTYLKVMPTMHLRSIPNYDDDIYIGVNATYLLGIGLRFTKLDVGLETNWGKVNLVSNNTDDEVKVYTNNTRIYIGVRF